MSVGVAIGLDVSWSCDWDKCLFESVSESLVTGELLGSHVRECMDPPAQNNDREYERCGVWIVMGASQSRGGGMQRRLGVQK
jgi:hypothetical protein